MRDLGYEGLTADQIYSCAALDVDRAFLRDLASEGYARLSFDDLVAHAHPWRRPRVHPGARVAGIQRLPVDDLVSMRIHGATPGYIRQMESRATGSSPPTTSSRCGSTESHRSSSVNCKALGYDRVPADDLVAMRIHGVSTDFIQGLQELGYKERSDRRPGSMRIHGVTLDYVRKMKDRHPDASADDLVAMRIHGAELKTLSEAGHPGPGTGAISAPRRFEASRFNDLRYHPRLARFSPLQRGVDIIREDLAQKRRRSG